MWCHSYATIILIKYAALQKPLLLEKAKPLSIDPTAHQNKAAYQTLKYFQLPKKMMKKMADEKKIKLKI